MDFSLICRTCLGTQLLVPILKEKEDYPTYLDAVCITTGLKIDKNDGLPQQMCQPCTNFVQDIINFRKKCKEAETKLLRIKSVKETLKNNVKDVQIYTELKKLKLTKDSSNNSVKVKLEPNIYDFDNKVKEKQNKLTNFNNIKQQDIEIEAKIVKMNVHQSNDKDKNCQDKNKKSNYENIISKNEKFKNVINNGENFNCDEKFNLDERNINDNEKFNCHEKIISNSEKFNCDDEKIIKNDNKFNLDEKIISGDEKFNNDEKNIRDEKFNCGDEMYISEDEKLSHKDKKSIAAIKIDDLIEKSDLDIQDDCKYQTEFLDVNFNSDCEDLLLKEEEFFYNNFHKYNFKNIKSILKSNVKAKSNTKMTKTDSSKTKLKTKMTKTGSKNTKSDITKLNTEIIMCDTDYNAEMETLLQGIQQKQINSISNTEMFVENDVKDIKKDLDTIDVNDKSHYLENLPFQILDGNKAFCKICLKEMSKRSIVAHISVRHPGMDERREKCDFCDAYIMKERMLRHRLKMHGDGCFRCTYCHKEYSKGEDLIDHVSKCTEKKRQRKTTKRKETMVECDVCNKSMQKASLKTHKDIKHGGMGPVCEHCGRRFGNKLRLSEHLRSRHGHDKLKCSVCDFRTASHTALANHERRHRGEKPFVCEQCGAKFHAPYLLMQHRHSHRTHKDIKCDQCPAAFKTNNTLHMHKMTCHNDKLYQCPQCARTFKSRQYVAKHLRAVHRHAGPLPTIPPTDIPNDAQ